VELEPRTAAPAHATGAVVFLPLAELDEDATFRLRDEGDVSLLATSIGRLGQLEPIEVRPHPAAPGRYQVIAGFRRLAALRLLVRERALVRVHETLEDDDAWAIALARPLLGEPLLASELGELRRRLEGSPAARWADELVEGAAARAPVDPAQRERFLEFLKDAEARRAEGAGGAGEEVEVTPDELAADLGRRLFELNQDLAVAADAWAELPRDGRRAILEQLRWIADLLAYMESR
jgi:ParB-like chromosome segregation protein Spo0J